MSAALPEMLTVQETAERMRMGVDWVYDNWRALGGVRNGRPIRIPVDGILAYWAKRATAEAEAERAAREAESRTAAAADSIDRRVMRIIQGGSR